METKVCTKCKAEKPIGGFYRLYASKDGRKSVCRTCESARGFIDRERNPEYNREWWAANGKKYNIRQRRIYREAGGLRDAKYQARYLLHNATKRGEMQKPLHCEQCGKEATGRTLHGHHEDYSKPLEVNWLCVRCHRRVHAGLIELICKAA